MAIGTYKPEKGRKNIFGKGRERSASQSKGETADWLSPRRRMERKTVEAMRNKRLGEKGGQAFWCKDD